MTDKLAEARKLERDAIVAWLRERIASNFDSLLKEAFDERDLEGLAGLIAAEQFIPEITDAIERGDHLAA